MPRSTRALSVLLATVVAAGGLAAAAPPASAAPAHHRMAGADAFDLLDFLAAPPQLSGDPLGGVLTVTGPVWHALPVANALSTDVTWLCHGTPIPGASGGTFLPSEAQAGCLIVARTVTTVVGLAVAPVTLVTDALQLPPLTDGTAVTAAGAPTVTAGSRGPQVGTTLAASAPEWNQEDVTTTYQWLRDGQPVAGATGTTYRLTADDLDQPISVRATGRKDGLSDGTATSNALTATVGDAPVPTRQPTISGRGTVGEALTVRPGTWGSGPTPTFGYQWRRDDRALDGATAATYVPTVQDVGHVLTVTVTARRPGYRPGTFRTAGVSVPKLASRLTASLAEATITRGRPASMTLVLAVADQPGPTGRLRVLDGTRVIKTVRLTAADGGRVVVRLGRLAPGTHRLKASYAGSDVAAGATSKVVRLTVRRTR